MTTRTAIAVIGANFGDEGKGLAVDALAARDPDAVVIRHNGGAQAGHTVVTPDGRRHVFSHFGAGTFAGAATFLSRFFVVSPFVFCRELDELATQVPLPRILVDPDAQVTTPYDVLVNRWAEESRGGGRHGSVGIGFGETIERLERGYPLAVRDVADEEHVRDLMARLREEWLALRLARLGIPFTAERERVAADPRILDAYLEEIRVFRRHTVMAPIDAVRRRRTIIFEGAQGLLLDQDRGFRFPFVTRSNTGLKNILALAADAGIDHIDAVYMTRPYFTRHGAGPLRHETGRLDFADVVDPTNRPNAWQGSLRFAPLDVEFLRDAIAADLADAANGPVAVSAGIGVSCLDQIRMAAQIRYGDASAMVPASLLPRTIADAAGLPLRLASRGPSRDAVELRGLRPGPPRHESLPGLKRVCV